MAFLDDFAVPSTGNIRHVSGATIYTMAQFHDGVQEAAAELTGSGDDTASIVSDDDPSSQENTKTIITLNDIFNVDQTATEFLQGGSVSQNDDDDIWGGLRVIGGVASSTTLKIAQNGSYLTEFWSASSGSGELLNILLQFKSGGSLIDSGDIQVTAQNLSNTLASFDVTLAEGLSTAAISTSADGQWSNTNSGDPLALSTLADYDALYDAAKQWKTLSLTNFNYPGNSEQIAVAEGVILSFSPITAVVLDDTAGSVFSVVTGTGTATVKTASTLAGGTAFLGLGGAATYTVQGATIVSGGVNIPTGAAWTIPDPSRLTGTVTMTGTGTLTLNDLTTDQLSGTLAAGNKIVVAGASTSTDFNAENLVFDASSTIENTSGINITVTLLGGQQQPTKLETSGTITFVAPTVSRGLNFTNLVAGTQVIVFDTGTTTVRDSVESSGTSFEWSETGAGSITVDYTIYNEAYGYIRQTNVTVVDSVIDTAITQLDDRAYVASTGLAFGTTATVSTGLKEFGLTTASTLQNFYAFMKESWRDESALKNVAFPISNNGPNSFTFADDWEFDGTSSINNLSQDGLRYLDSGGVLTASWAAILTVGDMAGFTANYQQQDGTGTTAALAADDVDQLIQVFGDATHGNFDYTNYLVLKAQGEGVDESVADVVASYGTLEDQLYVVGLDPVENGITTGDPSITGVTITDHGASPVTWNGEDFSITIQDTGSNSGTDIMRWLRYNYGQGGTFQGKDAFNWHDLVQANGTKFKTVRGAIYGDVGAAIKGVRVVETDGTTPHVDFDLFTADNGNTYVPPLLISVSVPNILDNSRAYLYNTTQATEIDNSVVSGGGGYTISITEGTDYDDGDTLIFLATYQQAGTAYRVFRAPFTATTTNLLNNDSQVLWDEHNAAGIDGSTVTECSTNFVQIQVEVNDLDNSTTKARLAAFIVDSLTTEEGIEKWVSLAGQPVINYINAGSATIDKTVANLEIDNIKTTALDIVDAFKLRASDGSSLVDNSTYTINFDNTADAVVVETGVSGLKPEESAQLAKLDDADFLGSGESMTVTPTAITYSDGKTFTLTGDGETTTTKTRTA